MAYLGLAQNNAVYCDCGNERKVKYDQLVSRKYKAWRCGPYCLLDSGKSARNDVIRTYKHDAAKSNREFKLSEKQLDRLFKSNCFYCGREPSNCRKVKKNNGEFVYNGIDRFDNEKGYIPGNVKPCCWECNYAKGRTHGKQFLTWVQRISNHQRKNKC